MNAGAVSSITSASITSASRISSSSSSIFGNGTELDSSIEIDSSSSSEMTSSSSREITSSGSSSPMKYRFNLSINSDFRPATDRPFSLHMTFNSATV